MIIVDPDTVSLIGSLHEAVDSGVLGDFDPAEQIASLQLAFGYIATLAFGCYTYDTERLNSERQHYTEQLQATLDYIRDSGSVISNTYHSVQDMSNFEKSVLTDALQLPSEDPKKLHSVTTRQYIKGRLQSGQSWGDISDTVSSLATPDTDQQNTAIQIFRNLVRTTTKTNTERELEVLAAVAALHPSKKDALDELQEASKQKIAALFDSHSPEEAAQLAASYFAEVMARAAEIK